VISPLALEAVRRIDALFEIERAINQSPERRKAVRQEFSAPLVADLEAWMRDQRAKLSRMRISRDREQGFHRIVSNDFRAS
jgi:transposase